MREGQHEATANRVAQHTKAAETVKQAWIQSDARELVTCWQNQI